jgi:hypothetical protein
MKTELDIYVEISILENKISGILKKEKSGEKLTEDENNSIKESELKIICLNWVLEKENFLNYGRN